MRFTWTPAIPGTYTLRFEADVGKYVTESNDNNNVYWISVNVTY